jgi:hypothetical protein
VLFGYLQGSSPGGDRRCVDARCRRTQYVLIVPTDQTPRALVGVQWMDIEDPATDSGGGPGEQLAVFSGFPHSRI